MANTITLEFLQPADQINLNDRHHRIAEAKLKAAWREAAYYAACAWRAGPSTRRLAGRAIVRVTLPVHTRSRRDPHNWIPTVKAIVDGLTDANLWPDDSEEYVEVRDPAFLVVDKAPKNQLVFVTIMVGSIPPETSGI